MNWIRSDLPSASASRPPRSGAAPLHSVPETVLVACLLFVSPSLSAQQPEGPGLTIYSQDLALVRTTVERALEAGERTVTVDGLPGSIRENSLLVLDPRTTLLGVHGRRSYQSADGSSAVSLDLDLEVGEPLGALDLAYLTGGMSWSASYNMIVAPDDRSARIDGYATVVNGSGTAYQRAVVQLLAGTVNVSDGRGRAGAMDALRQEAMAAPAPRPSRESFSGYHLYELDEPLTLHAGARRRIRLLGAESLPASREYVLPGQTSYYQQMAEPQRQEAFIRYRVQRPEDTGFSDVPLPAGTVRMYQPDDDGRVQLLGMDELPNTPAREELLLTVGRAFDIGGIRTQTEYERPGADLYESAWEVVLTNRTDERVVVQVTDRIQGEWEILDSSHEPRRLSAGRVRFDVPVPADGEAMLEYRVRVRN